MMRFILPFVLCIPLVSHAQVPTGKEASTVALNETSPGPTASIPAAASPKPAVDSVRAISSGIIPPKLVHTILMRDDGNQHVHISGRERVVLVYLTVNEAGQPTDLHIPQPVDDALDVEVLATIGKFRYQPGTLDGKPIPMQVHMHYVVPVGAVY
jgi:TonB family protein